MAYYKKLGVSQSGQTASFGVRKPQVQILPPRPNYELHEQNKMVNNKKFHMKVKPNTKHINKKWRYNKNEDN